MLFSPIAKAVGIAALVIIAGLALKLAIVERQNGKLKGQLEKCEMFRKQLAEESERQKAETDKAIKEGAKQIIYVDRIAKSLENKPLKGDCSTPNKDEWGAIL